LYYSFHRDFYEKAVALDAGELLLVNDRRLFHYTTPICPKGDGEGTRDVFVLTFPSLISDY
jgi:hypothetical protein